jgi:SNF2 family DNA or RNA helicase
LHGRSLPTNDPTAADSPKLAVLLELLKHSLEAREKVLVFSQSLSLLDLLEDVLQVRCDTFLLPDSTAMSAAGAATTELSAVSCIAGLSAP